MLLYLKTLWWELLYVDFIFDTRSLKLLKSWPKLKSLIVCSESRNWLNHIMSLRIIIIIWNHCGVWKERLKDRKYMDTYGQATTQHINHSDLVKIRHIWWSNLPSQVQKVDTNGSQWPTRSAHFFAPFKRYLSIRCTYVWPKDQNILFLMFSGFSVDQGGYL